MGTGKLHAPGGTDDRGQVEEHAGLTVAELVCDLMYAGKTRTEIAGYDDAFMHWVLCRPRDENGNLVRIASDLPRWAAKHLDSKGHWVIKDPQPYGVMFRQAMQAQGLREKEEQELAWQRWKQNNPSYGEGRCG